jgi:transglutaminase-like putative cysteine protease
MPELATEDDARLYLSPAEYVDSDHPEVRAFAREVVPEGASAKEKARALYVAVREIRYGYVDHADLEVYRASSVLRVRQGYCVGKASLYAALCRSVGIPARVAFADVTNHLATERLREKMGTNLFAWHGFTEVLLDRRWRKASPTFNSTLCAKFGVAPLDFDGENDALLQAYDGEGRTFMRYEVMRGSFHDVPAKFLSAEMARLYSAVARGELKSGDLESEAEARAS